VGPVNIVDILYSARSRVMLEDGDRNILVEIGIGMGRER
jgi:hypothetical protein